MCRKASRDTMQDVAAMFAIQGAPLAWLLSPVVLAVILAALIA